jgi:hypothetical protein
VFALVVATVGFVIVRRAGHRLDRQAADARLCTTAASSLELVNPNMPSAPSLGFSTSRTTAARVAAQLARAGSDPHPWDQEAGGTVVVRCQSGNVVWLVDGKGHAARVPTR